MAERELIKITVNSDKSLSIEAEGNLNLEELLDALSRKDMDYVPSRQDGWEYIVNSNLNVVYWATDLYHFNLLQELQSRGKCTLQPHENTKEYYEDYEWNQPAGRRLHDPIPGGVNWHEGERYDIALGNFLSLDQGGYRTQGPVWIRDRQTGKIEERLGHGQQIGNFHPVSISWKGRDIDVEKLLGEPAVVGRKIQEMISTWNVFLHGERQGTVTVYDDPRRIPTAASIKEELVRFEHYDPHIEVAPIEQEAVGRTFPAPKNRTQPFDVYLHGKLIDTVFYDAGPNEMAADVKRSLVNHDGYDPNILVVKGR